MMEMDNYREVFIEESRENISLLNMSLLAFEKDTADLTPVNELFRAAHTLKGMAATMGYDRLAGFTHSLEELLDMVRGGETGADRKMIDALFAAVDVIEQFVESIAASGVDRSEKSQGILDRLKAYTEKQAPAGPAPEAPVTAVPPGRGINAREKTEERPVFMEIDGFLVREAAANGMRVYVINVALAEGCAMKNVRAFMVVRNLSAKGEIIKASPSSKDIEEGNFDAGFTLGYVSVLDPVSVKKLIDRIAEIKSVNVAEIEPARPEEKTGEKPEKQDAEAAGGGEKKEGKKEALAQSVRVNVKKLDALMNLVGELVIAKIRLDQISKEKKYDSLHETVGEFDRIIDELQLEITDVRMLPVSHIFDRYPRVVRDLAASAGKQIELEITGSDIEIDRTVLEEINEPLIHLIRNSVAHGIEPPETRKISGKNPAGIIRLAARRDRNSVIIEVSDNGRGIDIGRVKAKAVEKGMITPDKARSMTDDEAVSIIAIPGFSTAEAVDKVSGRGVGIDVVKTRVEGFGGIFRIENFPGEGVKFILKLPLTLAIIQALLVKTAGNTYAVPVIYTVETLEFKKADIKFIQEKQVIVLREEVIPVVNLATLLGKKPLDREVTDLIIVEVNEKKIALEVEGVIGQQEIAIKSLGEFLKYAKGFSGVTILGDGRISLIVDIQALLEEMSLKL